MIRPFDFRPPSRDWSPVCNSHYMLKETEELIPLDIFRLLYSTYVSRFSFSSIVFPISSYSLDSGWDYLGTVSRNYLYYREPSVMVSVHVLRLRGRSVPSLKSFSMSKSMI